MHRYAIDAAALAVAMFALGFSIWQGKEQIRHNRVSVEPRINSYFSNNAKKEQWGIYIINNGVGPAFVSQLTVLVDGQAVQEHEYGPFYSALLSLNINPFCFSIGNPRPNDSFKVGEEIFLIEPSEESELTPDSCPLHKTSLRDAQKHRLDYILRIRSIYGDEFQYQYSKNVQIEVPSRVY